VERAKYLGCVRGCSRRNLASGCDEANSLRVSRHAALAQLRRTESHAGALQRAYEAFEKLPVLGRRKLPSTLAAITRGHHVLEAGVTATQIDELPRFTATGALQELG
jgi:hypothetical protein